MRQDPAAKAPAKEGPVTVVSVPPREVKSPKQPVKKETSSKKMTTIPQKEQKIASLHVPRVKPEKDSASLIVTSNVKDAKV